MCVEMRTKFQRLSELLISELQQRDQQVHEMDVRNRFISAMLRVQNRRHGFGVNGSMDGLLRGRSRTRTIKSKEERYSGKVGSVTDQKSRAELPLDADCPLDSDPFSYSSSCRASSPIDRPPDCTGE